ncbi:hypothetical protein [Nocardia noduli]|uniref:hypothetical protein n=1 Tax=Nocardia noduli TaxID=2815722 RepID=UPI001C21ECE2|nr:hypothetical protein [Nocardia noduli]
MKRGFTTLGCVVAGCCGCEKVYGSANTAAVFASIDEAMDFFVDGADGWELYDTRLMCPDCLQLSLCFNPGHDWHTSIGPIASGETLVTRQCTLCGLYIAEVLAA